MSVQLAARAKAQETHIVETQATLAALSAQIAQLERALYGPRSEKKRSAEGTDETDDGKAEGAPPARRKARSQEGSW